MEATPFVPGEAVLVQLGPAFVPARIVAIGERQIEVTCGGSRVRAVSPMHIFRPSPELDELIAKRAEPGVTQWDLSPLLKLVYDSHPGSH